MAVLHDLDKGWDGRIGHRVVSQFQALQSLVGSYGSTQVLNTGIRQTSHFKAMAKETQTDLNVVHTVM